MEAFCKVGGRHGDWRGVRIVTERNSETQERQGKRDPRGGLMAAHDE